MTWDKVWTAPNGGLSSETLTRRCVKGDIIVWRVWKKSNSRMNAPSTLNTLEEMEPPGSKRQKDVSDGAGEGLCQSELQVETRGRG